jgi:hypothetical protein
MVLAAACLNYGSDCWLHPQHLNHRRAQLDVGPIRKRESHEHDVKSSQHQVTTIASPSMMAPGARLQASIDRQGRLVLVPSKYEPEELFLHRPKVNRCLSLEQMEQTIAAAAGNPNDREDA